MTYTLQSSLYLKDPRNFPVYIERKIHFLQDLPPVHDHEFYELVYVVHGHTTHYYENKYYPLHAGDMILIRPGHFHTYILDEGASFELINCLFVPELLDPPWKRAIDAQDQIETFLLHPFFNREDEFHPRLKLGLSDARRIEILLVAMLEEQTQNREFASTVLRLKLFELFHLLIRFQDEASQKKKSVHAQQHHPRSVLISKIYQYIEENSEQKKCIDQLAALLGVSSRHLNRLFKQETGKTVLEMLHYVRIERAKQLLLHTHDRVVDIAAKVGYEDPSFFTKLFVRKVTCSPSKYREEMHSRKA
ncbi:AraC family transcriptional regulator [Paenibacillus sp.]|uniref:AraC family transcriptional regulator n=1 Tax=Paenibacillus sp. TaxID=58172 RepID=UPI0028112F89|nr:AraC family transcriptional regulator [Paenibacillus sp.]